MTLREVAEREAVEGPAQRLVAELGHQPADGTREAQVLARVRRPRAPAHAARDLQAGDEARDQLGHDVARGAALGLHADDGELGPVTHLTAHILRRRALGACEPRAGLGERAVVGERDRGLGAAELLHLGELLSRHAVDQDGDAPRRHQDPGRRAVPQQPLLAEQRQREAGLLRRALELPDHGLADLVRQLFGADLDEQRAERRPLVARLDSLAVLAVHPSASPSEGASRPSPTTSRYRPATRRARSRTRAMCAVRSVTLITPRASSMLNAWLHLSTWS